MTRDGKGHRWWSIPRVPPPAWWRRSAREAEAEAVRRRVSAVVISGPLEAKASPSPPPPPPQPPSACASNPAVPDALLSGIPAASEPDGMPSISFSFFGEAETIATSVPEAITIETKDDEMSKENTSGVAECESVALATVEESACVPAAAEHGGAAVQENSNKAEGANCCVTAKDMDGAEKLGNGVAKEGRGGPREEKSATLPSPPPPSPPPAEHREPGFCNSSHSGYKVDSSAPSLPPPSSPPPPPPLTSEERQLSNSTGNGHETGTALPSTPALPRSSLQSEDLVLSNSSDGGYEVLRARSSTETYAILSAEDIVRRLCTEPPQYASPRLSYAVTSLAASRETTCSPVAWERSGVCSLSDSYLCYAVGGSVPGGVGPSSAGAPSDYEELEYCAVRAGQRRATLLRGPLRGGPRALAGGTTRRVGRAWRAVRGWWRAERARLAAAIQRHARAEASADVDVAPAAADAAPANVPDSAPDAAPVDADADADAATATSDAAEVLPSVHRRPRDVSCIPRSRSTSRAALGRSRYVPEGQSGFEELRRYIKQGGDFCKDLSAILQERSEAETQYAKTLSKLSCKLLKASKDSVGSVNQAWQKAGAQMEAQSEIHRTFAAALSEEVVKPLRQLLESQHRIRKSVETVVDKTSKSLAEWRAAEVKSKKQSFLSARENEKLQDVTLDVRLGRNTSGSAHALHHNHKQVSDKECAKLESKRRKAEEHVKKADVEYYTFCIRAERARLEWETAVIRGSHCFQALEEERLQQLKGLAVCYLNHLHDMGPKLIQSSEKLTEPVQSCDVARDIQTVVSIKGTGQPIPEQLLPDFYAEHITLAMNRERRRQALVKILQLIRQDLERERRGKQGVESLQRALQQTPNFGAEDSQQNLSEKLHHMRSMLTYLEAARYKVQSALAELDGRARGSHPLAPHIQVTRDKQGLQQSVLKVPPWVRKESLDQLAGDSPDWTDRGAGDGNSVQPDSDFDEFSSQGSEKDYQSSVMTYPVISECTEPPPSTGARCRALYEYAANLYDELNLRPGDVINIHDKQADGWWLGELNGMVGIFPATYVEEIK